MAVTIWSEYRPGIGSVWARAVGIWQSYVADTTQSWAAIVTTSGGLRWVKITITIGANSTEWWLADGSCTNTQQKGVREIVQSTGWQSMPTILAPTYGARNTKTDWNTNMIALRRSIWTTWTTATLGAAALNTLTLSTLTGVCDLRHWTVQQGNVIAYDVTSIVTAVQSSVEYFPSNLPIDNGMPGQTLVVAGLSPAPEFDDSGIVGAIEDVALIDQDISINNGSAIFSARGKVRTG